MQKTNILVDTIIEALQDKKGQRITVVDLTKIDDTICQYFIIVTGNSPSQNQALAINVGDKARELCDERPLSVDGMRQAQWVAMDYSDVIVHIFLSEAREFYDIEHLWADAEITELEDEF